MARILVAEDERDIAALIRFILEQDGHAVELAGDGREALEKLGLEPESDVPQPDLLVLDVLMPLLDGLSVCRRLAARGLKPPLPVLVITGRGEARAEAESVEGVSAALSKPFDPRTFRDQVARLLAPRP